MQETTRAHTGRVAIRKFMAIAHALGDTIESRLRPARSWRMP
jgi:hypothetical protein